NEKSYIKRTAENATQKITKRNGKINVGMKENDVVADILRKQISGTDEYGGDYTSIVPLLPSGKKTSACHLTWTDDTYKAGDPAILELAGCYKRYHCPLARTVILGEPSPELQDLSEVVLEGIESALDIITPGVTCTEIEYAWRQSIENRGYINE